MGERFDMGNDVKNDINDNAINGKKADYGGDLANESGFDLNEGSNNLTKIYSYYVDDYLPLDDIKDSSGNVPITDDSYPEYTNDEIRNSLDSDYNTECSKFSKDNNPEQLDSVLDNFKDDNWSDLSLDEQKQSMTSLADYVADETGNKNPPEIVFRDDMNDGEYGGYNPGTNILEINENMLGDSAEAADTVAHEMWHAYQQQCALDPTSEKGREYQEGFDNYISPQYDFEGYQNQMVEAEAREFAQGFKDRLAGI